MKLALNKCCGCFALSQAAIDELGGAHAVGDLRLSRSLSVRSNPTLVSAVQRLGRAASVSGMSRIEVVDIPDDSSAVIYNANGFECVIGKSGIIG